MIEWLDNPELERPTDMPSNTIDMLTDMAIAAPGVCLYRILNDREKAKEAASGFSTIFNRRISGYIIDKLQGKYLDDEIYLDGVMDYCVMGNLQAVLDEYRHLCSSDDDFIEKMNEAFINVTTLRVDTDKSFGAADGEKFRCVSLMRFRSQSTKIRQTKRFKCEAAISARLFNRHSILLLWQAHL